MGKETIEQLRDRLENKFPKATRRRECRMKGERVIPCWVLEASVEALNYEKRKGIIIYSTINIKTGEQADSYYGVRSGEFKNGIIFNHCPFCGNSIKRSDKKKDRKKSARAKAIAGERE